MHSELEHVQQLCQAIVAQVRGRKLGEYEWVHEAASRCGGVVAYHATACGDLALWHVMEVRSSAHLGRRIGWSSAYLGVVLSWTFTLQ